MDKDQITKKLEEVILDVMPEIDSVNMNASIVNEYGINSVSIIKIIVAAEEKFDVSFTDYELALSSYDTFADLAATVAEKL
ncbi:MAG: acyl carrier protein [Lachnospiraceae bacterium]|nr:acyl carrier protein [Lachnospiraceae bacterium]